MERRLVDSLYLQDLVGESQRERIQSQALRTEAHELVEQARAQTDRLPRGETSRFRRLSDTADSD
jgi:hypothetical protein